jgi:hypothetical protein
LGLSEPTWFKTNLWQDYFYYQWSPTASLQAGAKTGISALLIGTGSEILNPPYAFKGLPQARPSNMIAEYLDSDENTNGGTPQDLTNIKFEAVSKMKVNNYNDQTYIVSP